MSEMIRQATIEDANMVGTIHYQAWKQTYGKYLDASVFEQRSAERSIQMFRESACKDVLVAEVENRIVGWCGYGPARDREMPDYFGEIWGIYLLQNYQGMKLGARLLRQAEQALVSQGFQQVYLWVLAANQHAIGFYETHGYAADGGERIDAQLGMLKRYRRSLQQL